MEGEALAQDRDGEDGRPNDAGACQDARLVGTERPQDVIQPSGETVREMDISRGIVHQSECYGGHWEKSSAGR